MVNIFCNINFRNLKWSIIKIFKKDFSMIFNFNRMNGFFVSICGVFKIFFCRIVFFIINICNCMVFMYIYDKFFKVYKKLFLLKCYCVYNFILIL